MTPELAFKLTQKENQLLSEWITSAKKCYEINSNNIIGFPYSDGDIAYIKFTEEANLSDREIDMMYVSNFFNKAYVILHVTIHTLKEYVSSQTLKMLTTTYNILEKYNLEHCLLGNISKEQYKKYVKEYDD